MHKTSSPLVPSNAGEVPPQGLAGEQKPLQQEHISDAPAEPLVSPPPLPAGHSILSREEKVEYRDQDGNLLDPEQVKELEGKVSFKTRYETRTRMVDAQGNEIPIPEDAGVAPPHKEVKADESKEASIAKSDTGAAKPASEGNEATAV